MFVCLCGWVVFLYIKKIKYTSIKNNFYDPNDFSRTFFVENTRIDEVKFSRSAGLSIPFLVVSYCFPSMLMVAQPIHAMLEFNILALPKETRPSKEIYHDLIIFYLINFNNFDVK